MYFDRFYCLKHTSFHPLISVIWLHIVIFIQSSAETYIRFIMNSIGGKTLSPDIIGTATISGAKLFLMKDLKLIYIFQDKLIIKFYFKVTKRNANLPFLSVNFPSVCSEITSQIVCKFLQIIVGRQVYAMTLWFYQFYI